MVLSLCVIVAYVVVIVCNVAAVIKSHEFASCVDVSKCYYAMLLLLHIAVTVRNC